MGQHTLIKIPILSTVLKYPGPNESAGRGFFNKFLLRAVFA
jgi:hypothetical protein